MFTKQTDNCRQILKLIKNFTTNLKVEIEKKL